MANQQNYNCPQCGLVDHVVKVSALVGAGTSTGDFGASQTALSQKLSPPTKPTYQSPWGCSFYFSIGVGVFLGTVFLITMIVQMQQALSPGVTVDSRFWAGFMQFSFIVIIPLIISVLTIVVQTKTARQRKIIFDTEYPRWQHAIAKWNELYYCGRNDVVFRPGKPQDCVPVSQMSKLLYKS